MTRCRIIEDNCSPPMRSFLLSVAATLALSTPVFSVAVWGQCGVSGLQVYVVYDIDNNTGYRLHW